MADLIVGAGATLPIDAAFVLQPMYDVFRMEANSTILADVDLLIKARRAEFGTNCSIVARGSPGTDGAFGPLGTAGQPGGVGRNGHNVTIEAGLANAGTLTIVTDGGAGGRGGRGPDGFFGFFGANEGAGNGGNGGNGGNAGTISLKWTRLSGTAPPSPNAAPTGHNYRSVGGIGGQAGAGGQTPSGSSGFPTTPGVSGSNGSSSTASVAWLERIRNLLWVQKQDMGPGRRGEHALSWDPDRKALVLFGGRNSTGQHGDTWEWDGHLWTQVADIGPAPRSEHGMTFDPVTRQTLLFGGAIDIPGTSSSANDLAGDTWLWDGKDWIQVADSGASPRDNFAIATDPIRECVVLFGGMSQQTAGSAPRDIMGDTWEWDGTEWTQRADTGPSDRWGCRMAFDGTSGMMILFGGLNSSHPDDTWGWDGNAWQQVADTGPAGRSMHGMAPDGTGVTLFGGSAHDPSSTADVLTADTWSFQDQRWRQIQDIGPSPRSGHDMSFDEDTERIMLYGGQDGTGFHGDTWYLMERRARNK